MTSMFRRLIQRLTSKFTKKMSEDWLEMDEVLSSDCIAHELVESECSLSSQLSGHVLCDGSPGDRTEHHLVEVDYLPSNHPSLTLTPGEDRREMCVDPPELHVVFLEILKPISSLKTDFRSISSFRFDPY